MGLQDVKGKGLQAEGTAGVSPGVEVCLECLRDRKEASVSGGESKREWGEQTMGADAEWHRMVSGKIMRGLPGHGKDSGLYLEASEQRRDML